MKDTFPCLHVLIVSFQLCTIILGRNMVDNIKTPDIFKEI
jgi:hypothetical protein